jgi:oligopeptide transport system ATP-binding protein
MSEQSLLEVEDLKVHFPVRRGGLLRRKTSVLRAVDGVSFVLRRGETLGLVGESGCGKSTTGMAVLRMLDVTSGTVRLEGADITQWSQAQLRPVRRRMQMVYQDPYGSLDPRMTVASIVAEPLVVHGLLPEHGARAARVAELLRLVGLRSEMAKRYPHEFSGGQRQRIAIARALAMNPALLICDEPVSALDVSIQAQVVNLFQELKQRLGLSYLFIAHNLAVVRYISDRIAVMYLGKIVEVASRDGLYRQPLHPYTQALLAAIPIADPRTERERPRPSISGEVPSVLDLPSGCRFHTRCPHAMPVCREVAPELRSLEDGHAVACHLHDSQMMAS